MTGVHQQAPDLDPREPDEPVDLDGRGIRDLPRQRPVWQAFAEVRGWRGGLGRSHQHVPLVTSDGVRLHAVHVPGPPDVDVGVVLLHGFAARHDKPAYARLADHLAARVGVLAVDLRGHGRSGGRSTLGDLETADVAAAVRWWRDRGVTRVVAMGVSMGATSTVLAAARGVGLDAAVLVSAPAWLEDEPRSQAMQALRRIWWSPTRRRAMWLIGGVTVERPQQWRDPRHPVDAIADVGVAVLLVHGVDDHYFPVSDAIAMADAARDATLWIEPAGFGHAEDGLDHGACRRLTTAVAVWADTGRFPP